MEYNESVDFLMVYIAESHPTDGFYLPRNKDVRQHRTLEERLDAATYLSDQALPFPVVVDNMSNTGNINYAGLPERVYIIVNDKIKFISGLGPYSLSIETVGKWLRENIH